MDLFAQLGAEHGRIAAVAAALDSFAGRLDAGSPADVHEAIRFVTFFRGYVEGLHHEREETVLFSCLSLAGFSPYLAHLRDQHREQGRLLLAVEKAISQKAPWSNTGRAQFKAIANVLASFERDHIMKERDLLFPVAQKELDPFRSALETSMERFERIRAPRWDRPWLEVLAIELVAAHSSH